MTATPYHIFSPLNFLSIIGLLGGAHEAARGKAPAPFTVDAVVTARDQAVTISLALASLARQSVRPRRVFVVDDVSRDDTVETVKAFARLDDLDLVLIGRKEVQGSTASLQQIARFSDADVILAMDGETVLDSPDYIQTVAGELMAAPDHASAAGFIRPLRLRDRRRAMQWPELIRLRAANPGLRFTPGDAWPGRAMRWLTSVYSDVLHYYFQSIVCPGELNLFGTVINPLGQAIAYRRSALLEVFEDGEAASPSPIPGQVYVSHGLMNRGYRHTLAPDAEARVFEPDGNRLFKQLYVWSTSWLAGSYYFPELVIGPFKAMLRHHARRDLGLGILSEDVFVPYQEPLKNLKRGREGKPAGWALFVGLFDKTAYPLLLILFAGTRWWLGLGYVVLAESLLYAILLGVFGKEKKFEFTLKALFTAPLRYLSIYTDMVTVGRFVTAQTRLAEAAPARRVAPEA
jgi:glycosyltransferase involved in cell wall biosynthesis